MVRFANGRVVTIGRERWSIASGARLAAQRVQLPLDLAWAMSVHKSQGMTLDRWVMGASTIQCAAVQLLCCVAQQCTDCFEAALTLDALVHKWMVW